MRRWNSTCALEPLQAAVMSFFPGVVVALNMGLMVSANRQKPTLMNMVLTVGLTVAVLVHIAIVQMFNDQVVQRQSSRFRAQLEQHGVIHADVAVVLVVAAEGAAAEYNAVVLLRLGGTGRLPAGVDGALLPVGHRVPQDGLFLLGEGNVGVNIPL